MGAAGLTSSCFEMASRAGTGFELELERVPLREPDLTPYELMLSESQERMVLVAERGREETVERIFRRWGLEVVPVGAVTTTGRGVVRMHGKAYADIPVAALVDQAPIYERPVRPPAELAGRQSPARVPAPEDPAAALAALLGTPELGDKTWIHRQYDSTVRSNTVVGPGADAAVLRLKGTPFGLALTTDVNPVYCFLDPREGGRQAVAEAARNLACAGALPIGLTDCLNFGNPERPEIAWQLRECIAGMSEACRALEVPVVSGNVSLYNETEGRSIHPTPTVAMLGWIERLTPDAGLARSGAFREPGEQVVLLGQDREELGGSAFERLLHDIEQGRPPRVDLEAERALGDLLREAFAAGWVRSCHDIAEGGLLVALAEMSFGAGLGCSVDGGVSPLGLFSESQGRAVLTVLPAHLEALLAAAARRGVPARHAGEVGGGALRVRFEGGKIEAPVESLRAAWLDALPRALQA
jgi:phosphoribosylformylglycinamidine synthase